MKDQRENFFKPRLLDLYITKKFLGTFFYAISLIVVIVIIFDFSEKIDDFIDRQAPLKAIIFDYYLNFIPYFVNHFSPLFTFISVIFFTSQLAGRTEIVAILSSGISFRRFLRPYLISSFMLALMSFMLANFVIPYTNVNLVAFEKRYIKDQRKKPGLDVHMQISPGTFIYIENYNKSEDVGYKFSLEKFEENKLTYKLNAEYLRWDSIKHSWQLKNYFTRKIIGQDEFLKNGQVLDTSLNFLPADFKMNVDNVKTMKFMQLRRFIEKEKLKGSENVIEYEVEKNQRIAFPFATVVLTLIAVSLSSRKVRGGIGAHLGAGITIAFAFILFMQISTTFAIFGNLPAGIAVWIPNILFGILGIYLLKIAPK
jgi:lipopolysaccharide export system permease protein